MNKNLNTLWCLTANNFYSYDSSEQTKAIYTNEEEALRVFNNLVKDYYKEEINMAKDLFDKEINSLEDILNEIEIVNDNYYLNGEFLECGCSRMKFLEYKYGIELTDRFMKCTISRLQEQELQNGDKETIIEEVYIILEKIETNLLVTSSECLLDNYKDLDNYIKNK